MDFKEVKYMFLYIIVNVLDFFLTLFAIIYIPSTVYKTEIIIIIGLAIFILNTFNYIKANNEKKVRNIKDKGRDIEAEKTRLLIKGLLPDYIESLGKNPYFKHAYLSGQEHEKKGNYKDAIKSYEEISKYQTVEAKYKVAAYILIGLCHFELFEFEEAMQNLQMALNIIKMVKIKEEKLEGKAAILTNIGLIYQELGQWKNALKKYKSTLRLYYKLDNKLGKANSFYNIHLVYLYLNKPKKALGKVNKAIQAYQEALKVYTLEDFPMDHAMTQNNLGNAYGTLAEVEDKAGNCSKAIQAYQEALKVRTLEDFPMQYAMTQNNLGNAYGTLAEVEDKAGNCNKAIQAYQEALKVYTLEDFPMQYALTQNNLGTAYSTLAEVKDKAKNCEKAIQAYQEALKVYTKEKYPEIYQIIEENINIIYKL